MGIWTGLLLSVLICFGTAARAADEGVDGSSSRVQLGNVLHNKRFEPDSRIVDTELKAQSGSLSRYSLKANLSYNGPALNDLNDPYMPNPDNRPRPNRTNLAGSAGLRYRVSSDAAWNASTGLRWNSPYQALTNQDVERQAGDENFTLSNPMVSYDRTYMLSAVQSRSSLKVSATTEPFYQHKGQFGEFVIEQAFKYNIAQSRWIAGFLMPVDFFMFDRGFRTTDGKVSNYFLSFVPSLEYKLADNFNFKTSVSYSFANMRLHGSWYKWQQQMVSQWVGFGWGITRDIYVNPYLSFFTNKPTIATTSLNLSTVFSIF